jgi:AbiV family abortive infection protein
MVTMAARTFALTTPQLGDLAEKTLHNARRLLDEAHALLRLGHYPTALSLSVLAAEEFGKHLMVFGALGLRGDDEAMWKDFHNRFRSHKPKYENVFSMAAAFLPSEVRERYMSEIGQHLRADQERKMAGFYVDLGDDGSAIHPQQVIGRETAENTIFVYEQVIGAWEARFEDADFTKTFEEGLDRGAQELRYALLDGDEATVMRYFGHGPEEERDRD